MLIYATDVSAIYSISITLFCSFDDLSSNKTYLKLFSTGEVVEERLLIHF